MYYQAGTPDKMPTLIKMIFAMPRYTIRAMYIVHAAHVITFYNGIGTELSALAFFIALSDVEVCTGMLLTTSCALILIDSSFSTFSASPCRARLSACTITS